MKLEVNKAKNQFRKLEIGQNPKEINKTKGTSLAA